MEEAVMERIRKDKTGEEWNKFHEMEAKREGNGQPPSARQIAYIRALAKSVGIEVEAAALEDMEKASAYIEKLRELARQMGGSSYDAEMRDKRVMFGMVTKLVYRRYCDQQKNPGDLKQFWRDVHAFYKRYQAEQEAAVKASMGVMPHAPLN